MKSTIMHCSRGANWVVVFEKRVKRTAVRCTSLAEKTAQVAREQSKEQLGYASWQFDCGEHA